MQNKVIVFGCNHQNMLGLVRSLGEKGIRPYCVLLKSKDGMVFRSKYPAECHWAESPQAGYDYIVQTFSGINPKPILLSSDDVTETLYDKNLEFLREHFYVPSADVAGKITFLMEKMHIAEYAQEVGFVVPKMRILKKTELVPKDIEYPVFTKSVKSIDGGKKEECKCCNEDELVTALNNSKSGVLLVQQYIDKKTEWCIQGFAANGIVYTPYVMRYLRFSEKAFGGYTEHCRLVDEEFKELLHKLIRNTCYTGLFSIEFLVDKNDKCYFTEINFRNDGAAYHATRGGANLAYLYCDTLINGKMPKVSLKDHVIGMDELKDFGQSVRSKKISLIKWIWQFVTADSHKIINSKDMAPFWCMLREMLFN